MKMKRGINGRRKGVEAALCTISVPAILKLSIKSVIATWIRRLAKEVHEGTSTRASKPKFSKRLNGT